MIKNVSVGRILGCGCCRDVRVGLAEYLTVFEPCRRRTEDKVGSSLDLAVLEQQTRLGITRIDGVLMS